jgi:hypothetical protein
VPAPTIAAEIGDITRFPAPKRLCGYTAWQQIPLLTAVAPRGLPVPTLGEGVQRAPTR